jgi:hypothetical protein
MDHACNTTRPALTQFCPRCSYRRPTRVITVRITEETHEGLKAAAHRHHTSLNRLCAGALESLLEIDNSGEASPTDNALAEPATAR